MYISLHLKKKLDQKTPLKERKEKLWIGETHITDKDLFFRRYKELSQNNKKKPI